MFRSPVRAWGYVVAVSAAWTAAECPGREPNVVSREPNVVSREIDRLIAATLQAKNVPASPRSDDAEFLRRACLDLHGRPPTAERAREFLDDVDPDKRRRLVDELLADRRYGRHQSQHWQTSIYPEQTDIRFFALVQRNGMERFADWMAAEFQENRPWDQFVRELLTAQGDIATRPAVVFTLSNLERARVRPDLLAVSTGKLFLGVQLQCVECHDHVTNEWKQSDLWGLAAFFSRTQLEGLPESVSIREGSDVRRSFNARGSTIVIPATGGNKGAGKTVRASFLGGTEPTLPDEGPFRNVLADWVTSPDNPYFAKAAVNRWWFRLFGRGLVHPFDDLHSGVESPHAELLDLLAREFRESGYDVKHLVRCLCGTDAYQRTSRTVDGNADDEACFSHMATKTLSPDVLYDSLLAVLDVESIKIDVPDTLRLPLPKDEQDRLRFVRFFRPPSADADEFTQGIPHALSLLNSETLNTAAPRLDKLAGMSAEAAVEESYLTVLARRPTPTEARRFAEFLAARSKNPPRENYQAILWILLNTSEFALNH